MSIHAALTHVTHYQYDRPVQLGPQVVRLRPAPHCRSNVISYSLRIEPAEHFINWQQDPFANYQARLVFPQKTREFKVTVDLVVEMAVYNAFDFFLEPSAENFPFRYEPEVAQELGPYLATEAVTPLLKSYLDRIDRRQRRTIDFLVGLNQQVQQDVRYLIRMEPGVQTPEQTLINGSGSCRDSGWLLVQLLRHCGLAARFVSGYLIQLTPDVKSLDGPSGTTVDFTDLHAWCEVYLPGAGWIGLDATSGLLAGEGHIPLACTPTPSNAAPIEGVVDDAEVVFSHRMDVARIYESPRVTKPYTEEQWARVLNLGQSVDQELLAGDVRLTMGGEPTFVAVDNRDAPEWNIDALGPTKRGLAIELALKLRDQYGQGGFLHFGQGKWYPGEQLPRWALSICWRTDGKPLWRNPSLFADERQPARYTGEDALRLMTQLAAQLRISGEFIQPGFEDTFYYLWRERQLPVNVDPFDARLDDEFERARLRRVFEQKLDTVVGYVMPLRADSQERALVADAAPSWSTGPWFFRGGRMYLVPGDSPMGLRLPLDALPWISKADVTYPVDDDPSAPRAALPDAEGAAVAANLSGAGLAADAGTDKTASKAEPPARFKSEPGPPRTALCIEVRNPARANASPSTDRTPTATADPAAVNAGVLYVFMPPLARLEDYLHLLAAVEASAQTLGFKIVLEGYPPPRDARITVLQVTPDPGVIEVNIHPAHNWGQLVAHTEFLYQLAFETRLSAEKFMIDGRHTGTGGGNHFVLGGATPNDSPFLRKPELLASLLRYWHNHPALSYFFSGLFIGPTSQAPRVDEARNDQLYELEIALREIERNSALYAGSANAQDPSARHGAGLDSPAGKASRQSSQRPATGGRDGYFPPWLVDRSLRNVLIDITGNTHRSEFCIDKLYAPDSATGRLGLLELRAFEMPPHARMSIVQQLLIRALVARFWKQPYRAPLARWGTALHDRWLLPTFIRADLHDVLTDMRQAGYALDAAWFAPHFEFRFPLVGQVQSHGIELTLRNALEPWHVMGEEGAAGGTVRYVDASLERIEVLVTGLNESRHAVTVNGRALPLQPTGTAGEFVAGVRYRAWDPVSALHPSIGVHAPLTFDIVDTWMSRSLGGCQYHVAHPGGRNYTTFPINAYEAESRRMARFFRMGHTPGPMQTAATADVPASREFPFTLDLRTAP